MTCRFSITMHAYFPVVKVVDGVRKEVGDHQDGWLMMGDFIKDSETGQKLIEMDDIKKEVNRQWKQFCPGSMKEVWIREEGETIFWHANFNCHADRGKITRKFK